MLPQTVRGWQLVGKPPHNDQQFRSLVQHALDIIAILEADGTIRYINPAVEKTLGHKTEALIGTEIFDLVHPDDTEQVSASFAEILQNPRTKRISMKFRARDAGGFSHYIELVGTNLHDVPTVRGIVINARDVTERELAEEILRESEEKFRLLAENAQDLIYLYRLSPTSGFQYVSPSATTISGYRPEEYYADPELLFKLVHEDDRHLVERFWRSPEAYVEGFPAQRWIRKDGGVIWTEQRNKLIHDREGNLVAVEGIVRDVTDRKRMEEHLEYQAYHDPLTDLPNRSLIIDRLTHALARANRRGSHVAILFMDLNDFKVINDSLGHEAGDHLLVALADRLQGCLRLEDTLARLGGDEFVILLEDTSNLSDATRICERILEELRRPFMLDEREVFVTPSIGIALDTPGQESPEELLRNADTAMYQAKEKGVHYRMFDSSMHEQVLRRLETENDLRRAIEREEFVAYYQPVVNLRTGEIVEVEALVRWEHPKLGLVPPMEFVPLAEATGLIISIGEWVLKEACRQIREWQKRYPRTPPLGVSVNLSAKQLMVPHLTRTVKEVLERTSLQPRCLGLEVTETVVVTATKDARGALLHSLRGMEVRMAIDDFGVGYSSLSYLKHLPMDSLKIDKSFMSGFGEDIENTTIVRTIIELAHAFGLMAIVEGVETAEQAALLQEMGCDMGQGFYFARPLPSEDVPALL